MLQFHLSLLYVISVEIFLPVVSSTFNSVSSEPCGDPLFLTPLLEKGKVMEARNLSKVTPCIGDVESYSGYITVNKKCQSNLFFWFFPAQKAWKQAPVLLWLQGGPGGTSLYGLFEELGPFSFEKRLKSREFSWNRENNLLFIDQPVGTGYSFTGKDCYATNETQVSEEAYSALVQFFHLFPELKENKFILAGESYAGYYVPAIGYNIHQSNQHADFKINLKGMMIGNGLMDGFYQGNRDEYLYQIGLSDKRSTTQTEDNKYFSKHHINKNSHTLNKACKGYNAYNYIQFDSGLLDAPYINFVQMQSVRNSIHVGNLRFDPLSENVSSHLADDDTKIKPLVEELLEHYPIVFYNGQVDTVCPYPLLVKFLRALNWSGAEDYKRASRHQWCEDGVLAGYHKSALNLHEVMVRAAGHMVPTDQPLWAFRLLQSVTNNPPDKPLASLTPCI